MISLERIFTSPSFNYFGCRKIQEFNYLLEKGIPVEHFYYNALESTDKVYSEIIKRKKRKWLYQPNVSTDSPALGINVVNIPFVALSDVKETIRSLVNKEKSLFLWLDNKHVSHNRNLDPELNHSVMVMDTLDDEQIMINDIPNFTQIIYSFSDLEIACNSARKHKKYMMYFDFDFFNLHADSIQLLEYRIEKYISQYEDSFNFYDELLQLFQPDGHVSDMFVSLYPYLDDALCIISGSRCLYAQCLQTSRWSNYYGKMLMAISKKQENLKILLTQINITKLYDFNKISTLIQLIKVMEMDLLRLLKNENKANLKSDAIYGGPFKPNLEPILMNKGTRNLVIGLELLICHRWISSYIFYSNNQLVGETDVPYFNLSGLEPNTTYDITMKVRDLFGNVSEISPVSKMTSEQSVSLNEDLALFKPVFTSSEENSELGINNVVDGREDTRWSSHSDESISWFYVDLCEEVHFSAITILWEDAFAKKYNIQTSKDAVLWTEIYSNLNSVGGKESISNIHGSGRYVRIQCQEKALPFGYSIYRFSVYR